MSQEGKERVKELGRKLTFKLRAYYTLGNFNIHSTITTLRVLVVIFKDEEYGS